MNRGNWKRAPKAGKTKDPGTPKKTAKVGILARRLEKSMEQAYGIEKGKKNYSTLPEGKRGDREKKKGKKGIFKKRLKERNDGNRGKKRRGGIRLISRIGRKSVAYRARTKGIKSKRK